MIKLSLKEWVIAAAVALLVAAFGWQQIKGKFWAWRADVWKDRAASAAADAEFQKQVRARHEAARENTNVTRTRTDVAVGQARAQAEHDAQEAEREQENPPALGAAPSDVERMGRLRRDYEEGTAGYRAAADRLQRARTR